MADFGDQFLDQPGALGTIVFLAVPEQFEWRSLGLLRVVIFSLRTLVCLLLACGLRTRIAFRLRLGLV